MRRTVLLFSALLASHPAWSGADAFSTGPVLEAFGENATVVDGLSNPAEQRFSVAFDVADASDGAQPNRGFNSVARFLNMHVRAGVPAAQVQLALVVHGKASLDLLSEEGYRMRFEKDNPSKGLVQALLEKGVAVILCGQSAAYLDIDAAELMPGVEVSLSAMTAHAQLQQQGYTVNPF